MKDIFNKCGSDEQALNLLVKLSASMSFSLPGSHFCTAPNNDFI